MLVKDNANVTVGSIVGPDGEVLSKPTQILSSDEARLLREYKKFLHVRGMREALYCNECFSGNLSDGMRAHVTDSQVLFECRHRMIFYQGNTY
jgi:hypothetical protein